MAQSKQEDSTINQIVQLVYPLSAEEHDRIVDEIRIHWHLPAEPREPWAQRKELAKEWHEIVLETQRKVLKLADRLAPGEQEKLLDELKLVWLRRAVDEGEESLRLHGGIPAEDVFLELEQRWGKVSVMKNETKRITDPVEEQKWLDEQEDIALAYLENETVS